LIEIAFTESQPNPGSRVNCSRELGTTFWS
jgi:hypothetical protein